MHKVLICESTHGIVSLANSNNYHVQSVSTTPDGSDQRQLAAKGKREGSPASLAAAVTALPHVPANNSKVSSYRAVKSKVGGGGEREKASGATCN